MNSIPIAIPICLTIGFAVLAAYYYSSGRRQKQQTLAELSGSGKRRQSEGLLLRWAAMYDRSEWARPVQNLSLIHIWEGTWLIWRTITFRRLRQPMPDDGVPSMRTAWVCLCR